MIYSAKPTRAPMLAGLRGPSGSTSQSESVSYDYSGLDTHLARQEEIGKLRDAKFASLYSGDIPSSIQTGNRIRELLGAVRKVTPFATERSPQQIVSPLIRPSSSSSSSSNSNDSGSVDYKLAGDGMDVPDVEAPPQGKGNAAKPMAPAPVAPPPQKGNAEDRMVEEGQLGVIDRPATNPMKRKPKSPFSGDGREMIA